MAIFGSKKNTVKKGKAVGTDIAVTQPNLSANVSGFVDFDISSILRKPRVTEKASLSAANNVYVFEVAPDASKKSIALAIRTIYNVSPLKIATARIPLKEVVIRGKKGVRKGGKKAYVYLKKGDTIEII